MTKLYGIDEKLKHTLKKKAKKSSKLWKMHIPIRIGLWVGMIVLTVYASILFLDELPPEQREMWFLFPITIGGLISILIILYYYMMFTYFVGAELKHKVDETLVLLDDRIYNLYHPFVSKRLCNYIEYDIFYDEIIKLEYNMRHDFLKIYAPVHIRFYNNYALNIVTKAGVLKERDKAFRILYLYYENYEDLLDELEKRSGVKIVKVDYLDKYTKEASYKKIDVTEGIISI